MKDSSKSKAQLISELEALRKSMADDLAGGELRSTEVELRASQERFRDFAEMSSDWFWEMGPDMRFTWMSERVGEIFGVAPEVFIGKTRRELSADSSNHSHWVAHLDDLDHRRPFQDFRYWGRHPEGGLRYVTASGSPIFSDSGEFLGYRGTGSDITAQKEAEDALRANQRMLRQVFDTLPLAVTLKDVDRRFLMANVRTSLAYGITPEEMLGKTYEEIPGVTQEAIERIRHHDEKVLETGETQEDTEFHLDAKIGKVIVRSIKVPIIGEQGKIIGIVTLSENITEKRKAEEALEKSEALLKAFFDNSPFSITLKDNDGRYTLANRQFLYERDRVENDYQGLSTNEFVADEYASLLVALDEEVRRTSKVQTREFKIPGREGKLLDKIFTKFPILGNDGEITGIGTVGNDVTDLRKIEQQLQESQKLEAVGRLAGGIAHEFNNAMQVILTCSEFLLNQANHPEMVNKYTQMIMKQAERTAFLTVELLGFSRQGMLQPEIFDVNALIFKLSEMITPLLGHGIRLKQKLPNAQYFVDADRGTLEQVLTSLCINAREAMPDGGTLTCQTDMVHVPQSKVGDYGLSNPGDYIRISVIDSGVGMTSEVSEHIFEPFFTTKGVGEGTGLALAAAYGTIQQQGGVISVQSELGKGSTFQIFLPKALPDQKNEEALNPEKSIGDNETILIAEDEIIVQKVLKTTLEGKGYRVLAANDGKEACALFQENEKQINLLILDLMMPFKTGEKVLEFVREQGSKVPVIFISGYSADSLEGDVIAEEAPLIIQKPYTPEQLFASVRDVLGH